jgi:NADPH-dependent curcumin reductase CurA
MRGWMKDARSYLPPVGIGEVMRAGVVGEVLSSRTTASRSARTSWRPPGVQEYAVSDGKGVQVVSADVAPLPTYLGTLGLTG